MDFSKNTQEDKQFRDMLARAANGAASVRTNFLSPEQGLRFSGLAEKMGLHVRAFGACEDFERAVYVADAYEIDDGDAGVDVLCISWDGRYGSPEHRDILGAILGLGLKRETLGDIRLQDAAAYVAVLPSVKGYILANLLEVGRVRVAVKEHQGQLPPPQGGVVSVVNVASLRLDAILHESMHVQREKAKQLVQKGICSVNHQEELRPDVLLKPGDVVSLRGFGRIRFLALRGESRKNRLFIEVETFLKKK